MKKLLTLLLSVMMVFASSTAVFAEEDTKDCVVTYAFASTEEYEWTVDESVTLSEGSGSANVSVLSASLEAGHQLQINCPGSVTLENGDLSIEATVTFDGISLSAGDDLATAEPVDITLEPAASYNPATQVVPVGEFEGTLTFTASIAE